MLTEKQKENIRQMSKDDLYEILGICSEVLGLISPKEYIEATGLPRSTLHYLIKNNKVKTFKISEHNFPLINFTTQSF